MDPEDLAAEYIARLSGGETVEKERYRARCADDDARAEFESLVAGAERVQRSLPRALGPGSMLSARYRILAEIGAAGGMSRVFSALDVRLERKVAIKVPLAQHVGVKELEDLFAKESKLLASLQHPGIVSVHEAGRDGDLAYIVMDLVDGASISDVIERVRRELALTSSSDVLKAKDGESLERAIGKNVPDGRTSLIVAGDWHASAARIALEIARTIEAAHGVGVIHRDLKPGNVMLVGGGHPVVLDFGLAGSIHREAGDVTRGLYGSVAYLAPEQAQQNRVGMDPLTDVYQLGLILYELTTLRRAFPGTAIGPVLARIKEGAFAPPRRVNAAVPRELEAITMMALELDPSRRYPSARALREDLERHVSGDEAPIAMRSNRWRRGVRAARGVLRRHPWRAGIAAAALVGISVWIAARIAAPPPLLFAFRARPSATDVIPIRNGDPVFLEDSLGVTIVTNERRFLYALSVFRRGGKETYYAPLRPKTAEQQVTAKKPSDASDSSEAPPKEPWAFEAPAGVTSKPLCTKLDQPNNSSEGLIVLALDKPRPDLERWFERLDDLIVAETTDGLAKDAALKEFREPPVSRGRDPSGLSLEERRANYGGLVGVIDAKDEHFELFGMKGLKIECPLKPAR
jgi:serine/threonine protein kinase